MRDGRDNEQDTRIAVCIIAAETRPQPVAVGGDHGTWNRYAAAITPEGRGRELSGLPADLVLEQEPEHKKKLYQRGYTMRLLIYRPGAGSGSGS